MLLAINAIDTRKRCFCLINDCPRVALVCVINIVVLMLCSGVNAMAMNAMAIDSLRWFEVIGSRLLGGSVLMSTALLRSFFLLWVSLALGIYLVFEAQRVLLSVYLANYVNILCSCTDTRC